MNPRVRVAIADGFLLIIKRWFHEGKWIEGATAVSLRGDGHSTEFPDFDVFKHRVINAFETLDQPTPPEVLLK